MWDMGEKKPKEYKDEVAQSVQELAKATEDVASEIKQFRQDLKDEWLGIKIMGKTTQEGKVKWLE